MDSRDADQPAPPTRRGRHRAAVAGVMLLALVGLLALGWRPILIGAIDLGLRTQGLGPFDAGVAELSTDRLVLDAVTLGPAESAAAKRVSIGFSIPERRLLDVELDEPRLDARLADGKLEIPALAPLLDGGPEEAGPAAGRLPALPFRSLALDDFTLRLTRPEGDVALTGDLRVAPAADRIGLDFDGAAETTEGTARAAVDGTVAEQDGGLAFDGRIRIDRFEMFGVAGAASGALALRRGTDGGLAARLTLDDGRLAFGDDRLESLSGTVAAALPPDGAPTAEVDLEFRSGDVRGFSVGDGNVSAGWRDGRLDAHLALPWQGGRIAAEIAYPTDAADRPLRVTATGRLDAAWLVKRTGAEGLEAGGALTFDATLALPPPERLAEARTPPEWLALPEGRVTLGSDGLDLRLPDRLRTGPLAGRVTVAFDGAGAAMAIPDGLRAAAATIAPPLRRSFPPDLAALFAGPVRISLTAAGADPAVRLDPMADGYRLSLAPRIEAGAGSARATSTADGRLLLGPGFDLRSWRFETATVTAERLPFGDLRLGGRVAARDIEGGTDVATAVLDATLRAEGRPHTSIALDDLRLTAAGRLDWQGGRVAFAPTAGRLRLGALRGKIVEIADGAAFDLVTRGRPPLRYDPATGRLDADILLSAAPFTLAIPAADPPIAVVLRLGQVRLAGTDGAIGLRIAGGGLDVPAANLEGRGLDADLRVAPNGDHAGRLRLATLRHAVPVPWFVPLSLDLNSRGRGDRIGFDGRLADTAARMTLSLDGEHRLEAGTGHADLTMPDILFLPTVLHPRQLFPVIEARIGDFDGTLGMHGRFDWGPSGVRSAGGLSFDVRRASAGDTVLENASMDLVFDNLAPPSTPPGQRVTFQRLVASLPFTDGAIDLQVMPGGQVIAEVRSLDLFGGRITTDAVTLAPGAAETAVTLAVADIDLERLMAFTEFGELVATGKLAGTLPVVLREGGMTIRGGRLGTTEPGHLRYVPKGVGPALENVNEATGVLMDVVRDFDYRSIEVGIDETDEGEMTIAMRIDGKSPKVYGGLPVILNLDVSGPLQKIIADALRPYQLPSDIQERIQRQPPR